MALTSAESKGCGRRDGEGGERVVNVVRIDIERKDVYQCSCTNVFNRGDGIGDDSVFAIFQARVAVSFPG